MWSERQWARLAQRANGDQYRVCLPWETQAERYRAIRIAEAAEDAEVLPRMTSGNMMAVLHGAYGVVGAECGWTALARALDVSVQTIEAAAPEEDGALGVWDKLRERIAEFGYR